MPLLTGQQMLAALNCGLKLWCPRVGNETTDEVQGGALEMSIEQPLEATYTRYQPLLPPPGSDSRIEVDGTVRPPHRYPSPGAELAHWGWPGDPDDFAHSRSDYRPLDSLSCLCSAGCLLTRADGSHPLRSAGAVPHRGASAARLASAPRPGQHWSMVVSAAQGRSMLPKLWRSRRKNHVAETGE